VKCSHGRPTAKSRYENVKRAPNALETKEMAQAGPADGETADFSPKAAVPVRLSPFFNRTAPSNADPIASAGVATARSGFAIPASPAMSSPWRSPAGAIPSHRPSSTRWTPTLGQSGRESALPILEAPCPGVSRRLQSRRAAISPTSVTAPCRQPDRRETPPRVESAPRVFHSAWPPGGSSVQIPAEVRSSQVAHRSRQIT
jgi:hypothetical protein